MDTAALGTFKLEFLIVVVLIALDVIFGIASALKMKSFQLQRMYEFLAKDVLPCLLCLATFIVFVYAVMPVFPSVPADLVSLVVSIIAFVFVWLFLAFSIIKSVTEIAAQPAPAAPKV